MANAKLGRPSKEKNSMLRGLVSDLLWFGKVETTLAKAKSVRSQAEKIITLAINSYEDIVKVSKEIKDEKGVKVKKTVSNDGPKKLQARRKMMAYLMDRQEQRKPKESVEAFEARTNGINHPLLKRFSMFMHQNMQQESKKLDKVVDTLESSKWVKEEAIALKWQSLS